MAKISVLDNSISSYQLEMYFMKYTINVFYCIFLNNASGVKKTLMLDAIKVGREHNVEYVCKGKSAPLWLHMKYKFYEIKNSSKITQFKN